MKQIGKEKVDPFVGTHTYYLYPGDSMAIDSAATEQWERPKKVTFIISEIPKGDKRINSTPCQVTYSIRKPHAGLKKLKDGMSSTACAIKQ